ncbi:MAG: tRNA (adenosine(37)-N6)-threonylcarbamoyltransferase complex transferase subunit TsaD [Bacteroides sp.]|nr:MAG: tRNA (adenosine(37)-N6)-threonylcarbamoyltransferase complex transferase subunit TsaD [Bacteroides sp.]
MKIKKSILILGIETSCDDTSIAICRDGKILVNIVYNQLIHKNYGGVVPELASRNHEKNIVPTLKVGLNKAKINKYDLDAISFTKGPGLSGSLLVGVSFSKALAMALKIPIIGCNHIEGHIMSNYIDNCHLIQYPFLCLIASGGHTQLYVINSIMNYNKIGDTLDDSIGETFDKLGKFLGFQYPCGSIIDRYSFYGDKNKFVFSKPKIKDYDFSFSGFKTSVIYFIKKQLKLDSNFIKKNINDLCASIQYSLINILTENIYNAIKQYNIKSLAIAGGVASNSFLRKKIYLIAKTMNLNCIIPKKEYCTDNAAMISILGYYKYLLKQFDKQDIHAVSRLKL